MSVVERLLKRVANRYGLVIKDRFRDALESALEETSRERQMHPEGVLSLVQNDDAMLREFAGLLTVGESFFYRHYEQLGILIEVLRKRLRAPGHARPITIWSTGCADGQEPYSIAIACTEQFTKEQRSQIQIIASDLNPNAIERARLGYYSDWSFRGLNTLLKSRYFEPMRDSFSRIRDDIRKMVQFDCLAAQEHAEKLASNSVDFIFFRNVVIYLDSMSQEAVYDLFCKTLRLDGLLFLAPSDPSPPRELFRWFGGPSSSVYAQDASEPALTWDSVNDDDRPFESVESKLTISPARTSLHDGSDVSSDVDIAVSEASDDIGEDHHAYMISGQQHLENDHAERAVCDFRRAVFLCPTDPLARFWYAVSLQRSGVPNRSLFQIQHLVLVLNKLSSEALLSDGQTTVGDLLSATMQLKERLI